MMLRRVRIVKEDRVGDKDEGKELGCTIQKIGVVKY